MKKTYEIPVHNEEVRMAVSNGDQHANFEDKWADTHLLTEHAHTPEEALSQCARKHPERLGFVLGEPLES